MFRMHWDLGHRKSELSRSQALCELQLSTWSSGHIAKSSFLFAFCGISMVAEQCWNWSPSHSSLLSPTPAGALMCPVPVCSNALVRMLNAFLYSSWILLYCRGFPVHCRIFNCISGAPHSASIKHISRHCHMSPKWQNYQFKESISNFFQHKYSLVF